MAENRTDIYKKNPALKPDGTYTDDFNKYMIHHQEQVARGNAQPTNVIQLMKDYNYATNITRAIESNRMTPDEERTIKQMRERAKQLKQFQAKIKMHKMAKTIKDQMINQDLDNKVYHKLAVQFEIWKKQKSVIEANKLLDIEIREKYGGLKKDAKESETKEAQEEEKKKKKARKKREKRQRQKERKKTAAAAEAMASPNEPEEENEPVEENKPPATPISEEVPIPQVRGEKMYFNTDPRLNPYIFTESKAPIIKDIPLTQVVLISAPSGFFHDIPNSQIYDSFDNAFGNVLLIQRQSRDRVIIVFNDSETAETLIRQCNGGCTIKHPFEDREIQFYVMPWKDTMEMERRLMGGRRKTRRKRNRKKRTRRR